MPSSSHAFSNSLVATIAYQYWCPNSCSVTISGNSFCPFGAHQNVSPVMNVGYSIPPACSAPCGGSTTVICAYGYGPYHSSKRFIDPCITSMYRCQELLLLSYVSNRIFTAPWLPSNVLSTT